MTFTDQCDKLPHSMYLIVSHMAKKHQLGLGKNNRTEYNTGIVLPQTSALLLLNVDHTLSSGISKIEIPALKNSGLMKILACMKCSAGGKSYADAEAYYSPLCC